MRLTLRTLLAYLDDTLEPAQAKLIGQKVAESEAAQELIGRIKQVTRRRRLTTPPMAGPGAKFDPNTIAEYIDSVLPGDQVAELEETCLASDVHLAEVAACHQVLTLVLGEPALVPPTARQRMYGLIRGREAIPDRKVPSQAAGQRTGHASTNGEDEETLLGLPFALRDVQFLRWLVAVAVGCLVLGVGIAIWMAGAFRSRPAVQALLPAGDSAVRTAAIDAVNVPEDKAQPVQKLEAAEAGRENLPMPKPEPASTAGTASAAGIAAPDQGADVPRSPKTDGKPAAGSSASILTVSTKRAELGKAILASPTVLLQRSANKDTWQRLKPQTRVWSNDYLVSLPGYRSELRMDTGAGLVLWGNLPEYSRIPVLESAVVLHVNPDVDLDFTLDHGRVVLSNHKAEGLAVIRLRFLDEVWDVTLPDQNAEVAAELFGFCLPYSKEAGGGESDLHLNVLGLKGQAQIKIRYEQHLIPSPSLFTWDNTVGAARTPLALPRPPDWWTDRTPAKTPMQALDALTNRLALKSIDVAIAEAKSSPDVLSRVLALRCLGAMADYPGLLDCLADDKHPDVRTVAIEELRHLLGLSAKNDDKLHKALKQKNYPEGQAQTMVQLVHGFSLEQWADPTIRTTAVEYLMHEKLAIRQLTHTLLMALEPDGRKILYDPTGDRESRERGYEAWKKLVLGSKPVKR